MHEKKSGYENPLFSLFNSFILRKLVSVFLAL